MTLSLASLSIDMNSGFWCKIQVWNTTKNSFEEFLAFMNESGNRRSTSTTSPEALFARFLDWQKQQQERSPAKFVHILTGDPSGIYYPLGNALSAIYGNALPDTKATVQVTQGSVQNLTLLQAGRAEVAF